MDLAEFPGLGLQVIISADNMLSNATGGATGSIGPNPIELDPLSAGDLTLALAAKAPAQVADHPEPLTNLYTSSNGMFGVPPNNSSTILSQSWNGTELLHPATSTVTGMGADIILQETTRLQLVEHGTINISCTSSPFLFLPETALEPQVVIEHPAMLELLYQAPMLSPSQVEEAKCPAPGELRGKDVLLPLFRAVHGLDKVLIQLSQGRQRDALFSGDHRWKAYTISLPNGHICTGTDIALALGWKISTLDNKLAWMRTSRVLSHMQWRTDLLPSPAEKAVYNLYETHNTIQFLWNNTTSHYV
ncbi:hypothetical protein FRC02_002557 [Tulasnella sp. 418]|nr:hypothetical protein FRC02_002557 [Tulasnella sp. 418]